MSYTKKKRDHTGYMVLEHQWLNGVAWVPSPINWYSYINSIYIGFCFAHMLISHPILWYKIYIGFGFTVGNNRWMNRTWAVFEQSHACLFLVKKTWDLLGNSSLWWAKGIHYFEAFDTDCQAILWKCFASLYPAQWDIIIPRFPYNLFYCDP